MIELTVALPIWNSKRIAWLPLEGLCNQRNIDFEWELLIAEEQIHEFGIEEIKKYSERLKQVGCVSLKYIPLDYRIPLAQKWRLLSNNASIKSKMFLLLSADSYPEDLRLRRTLDNSDCDWLQNRAVCLYSLHYKKIIEFDQRTFGNGCKVGANMAIKTSLIKNLPISFETSGLDNWLFKKANPQKIKWIEEDIMSGVDTDGLNNISFARRMNFNDIKPPFKATTKTLKDLVPEYIEVLLKNTLPR